MKFNISDIRGKIILNNGNLMPYFGLGVYKSEDGDEVVNAIQYALNAGYRLIDTASFYHNEAGVGEAIKKSNLNREDVFVTTKVWNTDQGYDKVLKAFDTSLQLLQLDYLDLYLMHWPVPGLFLESWKAMVSLLNSGRVKSIGVSNCMIHHLEEIIEDSGVVPAVLQNEFHPQLRQQEILDFCQEKNIQYQAWAPLMRGRLLENEILKELAQKHNKTVSQIILRWDLQKGVATIPKSVHRERIEANANIFDFSLSEEDLNKIDSLDTEERTGAHPDNFMSHFGERK